MEKSHIRIIKIAVQFIIFILGIFLASSILNKNSDKVEHGIKMTGAQLPVIYFVTDNNRYNPMEGHAYDVDTRFYHRRITPFSASEGLRLVITGKRESIKAVDYSVSDFADDNIYDKGELVVTETDENENSIFINTKNLNLNSKEALLTITLRMKDSNVVNYYSRIQENHSLDIDSYIDFQKDFIKGCVDKKDEISKYIEAFDDNQPQGLSHVNINSGFTRITWDKLKPELASEPEISIEEMDGDLATFSTTYYIEKTEKKAKEKYRVSENYRIKQGADRLLLLNFDRNCYRVFEGHKSAFGKNRINIGIGPQNIDFISSQDGSIIAFVRGSSLFSYNNSSGTLYKIFDYGQRDDFKIKLLKMDENGDIDFIMYGYYGSGDHEGSLGVGVYHFSSSINSVKEQCFIQYNRDYPFIENDIGRLAYVNKNNGFYMLLANKIYRINLFDGNTEIIIDNVKKAGVMISHKQNIISWKNNSSSLNVLELDAEKVKMVAVKKGSRIVGYNYIGDDLVYGVSNSGKKGSPAKKVFIVDTNLAVRKKYSSKDKYIKDVAINDNVIRLFLVKKEGSSYVDAGTDEIIFSGVEEKKGAYISSISTDVKQIEEVINFYGRIYESNKKTLQPSYVADGKFIPLTFFRDSENEGVDYYYVLNQGRIEKTGKNPAKLVNYADANNRVVIYPDTGTIWQRSSFTDRFIRDIYEIPDNFIKGTVDLKKAVNLSGCSMDNILYFVKKSGAVMADTVNGKVLIIGYDPYNLILLKPSKNVEMGDEYYYGLNDSRALFEKSGNKFYTYLN